MPAPAVSPTANTDHDAQIPPSSRYLSEPPPVENNTSGAKHLGVDASGTHGSPRGSQNDRGSEDSGFNPEGSEGNTRGGFQHRGRGANTNTRGGRGGEANRPPRVDRGLAWRRLDPSSSFATKRGEPEIQSEGANFHSAEVDTEIIDLPFPEVVENASLRCLESGKPMDEWSTIMCRICSGYMCWQQLLDRAAWFVLQIGLTQSSKLDLTVLMAAICASCMKNNDDSASASPSDNSSSVNRRWDSVIQEVLRNAVKKFNDYMNSYRNQSKGVDVFERGSEVVDDEDWDWDRWRKHFSEVDEQERIVSILKVIQRLERIISQFGFYSRTSYSLQVHPTVEAFKHAYAVRMNIGDPDFVNVSSAVSNMLSPKFAASFTAAINSQCAVLWTSSLGDQYAAIVNAQEEGPCHALHSADGRTICQLVAQKLEGPNSGMLAAANDPRKGGFPADNLLQALRYAAQFGSLRYRRCSRKSGVHHALNPDPYSGVFGLDREKYARNVEDLITFGTSRHVASFISEAIQANKLHEVC
ncbi:Glutathione hydrolase 1 [Camellia lanceoleosa]|uniref:Glutathione hydrolase 1 n=1 Tax=Camellia lanceoleosa TaxID=1840588 RepID=A0ACC0IZW5_9ERIC|nr:Glutathione hydrolase 1 [Camellia lanceoleosa]